MIDSAANQNSSIVLLPELWSCGYDWEHINDHALQNRHLVDQLCNHANELSISIGGSLFAKDTAGTYSNEFSFIQPGSPPQISSYRKIHLFGLLQEPDWLQPGNSITQVPFPWGKAGLTICYDLRFPELFRTYALEKSLIIFIVAEWPIERIEHWKVLLRARAIENQVYIAAVNAVGKTGSIIFGGSSAVISPCGEIIAEGSKYDEELLSCEIDLDQCKEIRERIPVFNDRRPDMYRI